MLGALYALVTVLAWGTWLAPSQKIAFRNQQIKTFYVASANLALASVVASIQGFNGLTWSVFWLPFIGGLVWSVSGFFAFTATHKLGMARAYGIWAPVNVIISVLWGVLLFGEMTSLTTQSLVILAIAFIVSLTGIVMIIIAKGFKDTATPASIFWIGVISAVIAGIFWGSYFIPIKLSAASLWIANLPLSVGIFTGSSILAILSKQPISLNKKSDTFRVMLTGLLWGIGNIGMLLLVDEIGAARGFTISQLGVVVNGLLGIFILKDPQPQSRAAWLTLVGCLFATIGGILLGSVK